MITKSVPSNRQQRKTQRSIETLEPLGDPTIIPPAAWELLRSNRIPPRDVWLAVWIWHHQGEQGCCIDNERLGATVGNKALHTMEFRLSRLRMAGVLLITKDERRQRRLKTTWAPLANSDK